MSLNLVMKACLTTSTATSEASTMTTSGNSTHKWSKIIAKKLISIIVQYYIATDESSAALCLLPGFHENCSMFLRHTMSRRMQLVNLSLMSVGNKKNQSWINLLCTHRGQTQCHKFTLFNIIEFQNLHRTLSLLPMFWLPLVSLTTYHCLTSGTGCSFQTS